MGSLVHYSMSEQLQCPCNRPGWQLISAGAAPAPDTQAASGEGQCSLKDLQSLTHHSEGQHRVPKIRLPPPNLGTSKNRLICVFLSPPAPPPHWHGSHPETPREVLCSQGHGSTPAPSCIPGLPQQEKRNCCSWCCRSLIAADVNQHYQRAAWS